MMEVNGRFEFVAPNGIDSACWLRIWTLKDQPMKWLVLMTELEKNPGMSVTNAIETIVLEVMEEYDLDPDKCLFVEHYQHLTGDLPESQRHTFDLVKFKWNMSGPTSPIWAPRARKDVERTIGEEIMEVQS